MKLKEESKKCVNCRNVENMWIEVEMILNAVGCALDGEHELISDFEQSFPIVRKAMDLFNQNQS